LELCWPVSEEEIKGVVKSMPRDKAPDPDGIPVEFYINCWQTVKTDFVVAVKYFFRTKSLPPQWKSYFHSLDPEGEKPHLWRRITDQ